MWIIDSVICHLVKWGSLTCVQLFVTLRKWQPTPGLLPGESHGWRSLVGYSPWGRKESDTTERLHLHCMVPGSSVQGILQARILEWVAVSSSKGSYRESSWPRDGIKVCIAGRFFTNLSHQGSPSHPQSRPLSDSYIDAGGQWTRSSLWC